MKSTQYFVSFAFLNNAEWDFDRATVAVSGEIKGESDLIWIENYLAREKGIEGVEVLNFIRLG